MTTSQLHKNILLSQMSFIILGYFNFDSGKRPYCVILSNLSHYVSAKRQSLDTISLSPDPVSLGLWSLAL